MAASPSPRSERPNIVVVHPHNLGQHLGCYGWDVETPNVDALARAGTRFEHSYCTAPHCSPARGSLWTGNYPHTNGLVGLTHLGWELDDDETTLVMDLNEAGYATHLFGVQHISTDPTRGGFQHVQGSTHDFNVDEPASDVADSFAAFLDGYDDDQPFFASVGFSEVHREPLVDRCLDCGWTFDLPGYESGDPDEVTPLPYLPDRPGIREDLAHFHGMVGAIDDAVGRIDDAIDEAGLREDTVLVFTTDHGIGFPRAMGTCYDPGVEVALIVRWPDHVEAGVVREELVSHVDFRPTVLDLIDEFPPADIAGRSFAPLLTGDGASESEGAGDDAASDDDAYTPRERVFLELTWHSKYNPIRAVRTDRYKYVRNFGDVPLVYIPAPLFSSEAGKEVRAEFYGSQRPEEELYDLEADPHEQENLVGVAEYESVHAELRDAVDAWMEQSEDRLLAGKWPPSPAQEERVWKSPWIPRPDGERP